MLEESEGRGKETQEGKMRGKGRRRRKAGVGGEYFTQRMALSLVGRD